MLLSVVADSKNGHKRLGFDIWWDYLTISASAQVKESKSKFNDTHSENCVLINFNQFN